jgi:acyl dehydratase
VGVDRSVVGRTYGPWDKSWTADDVMLYALAVGCGWDELEYVTENSEGVALRVLPTFAVTRGIAGPGFSFADFGDVPLESIVHGEQRIELSGPIPVEGAVRVSGRIADVYDKGTGALVVTEWDSVDASSGEPRFRTRTSFFLRGLGGFGGSRGPATSGADVPQRAPDHTVELLTAPTQTLVYRVASGDHNRIHSDPEFARVAGFERPILMGLGTMGFAGRALLRALCGNDPARFRAIEGRFASPGYPGDTLTTDVWCIDDGVAAYRTCTQRGDVVIDRGRCEYAAS